MRTECAQNAHRMRTECAQHIMAVRIRCACAPPLYSVRNAHSHCAQPFYAVRILCAVCAHAHRRRCACAPQPAVRIRCALRTDVCGSFTPCLCAAHRLRTDAHRLSTLLFFLKKHSFLAIQMVCYGDNFNRNFKIDGGETGNSVIFCVLLYKANLNYVIL